MSAADVLALRDQARQEFIRARVAAGQTSVEAVAAADAAGMPRNPRAPEVWAALYDLLRAVERAGSTPLLYRTKPERDAARAALAKATGSAA